jgi:chemotaxis protein CheY-P-specific phosphatase CheC
VESAPAGRAVFPAEQNAIREMMNMVAGVVAPSLAGYLGGKSLTLSNATVESKPRNAIMSDFQGQYVQVSMDYQGVVSGKNLIIFNLADAGSISSLMMGDESGIAPAQLTEAHQSTITGVHKQLLSSMATQFGQQARRRSHTHSGDAFHGKRRDGIFSFRREILSRYLGSQHTGSAHAQKLYHVIDFNLATGLSAGPGRRPRRRHSTCRLRRWRLGGHKTR